MLINAAKSSGHVTKRVTCEKCRCAYLYELSRGVRAVTAMPFVTVMFVLLLTIMLPPVGLFVFRRMGVSRLQFSKAAAEGGKEEAVGAAHGKLRKELRDGVEPVACPECGWYQRDMVREVRSRAHDGVRWLAVGSVLTSQPITYLVWKYTAFGPEHGIAATWLVCTLSGVLALVMLATLRWVLAFRVNPNAGYPAARPPYPGAPAALRETDRNAALAASIARITPGLTPARARLPRATTKLLPPARKDQSGPPGNS